MVYMEVSKDIYINEAINISSVTIPIEIKNNINNLSYSENLRKNSNILHLCKIIRNLIDPKNIISDIIKDKVRLHGFTIVSGLPVDKDIPATPIRFIKEKPISKYIAEKNLIYLSSIFGKPHSYIEENNGEYIHDLYPIKGNEKIAAGTGSEVDLELHTEIAFDNNKPDYILLTAVRNRDGQNVPTTIANVNEVLNELTEDELRILEKGDFFIRAPYSFSGGDNIFYRRSLVNLKDGNRLSFNFNPGVTYCITSESNILFEKLRSMFNKNVHEVFLEPGVAIIIDNNQMLHGRNSFIPKFDGKDRWLQRIYVKR